MLRFAPQHFGTGPGRAWVEQQEAEDQKATELSTEIQAILNSAAYGKDGRESRFWRLVEYDCVHEAWKSEKETEVKERAELERLREMHGMVREIGEETQTREEIRAELERLRELFDMEKEAGE